MKHEIQRSARGALVLAVILCLGPKAADATAACESSGYCSVGLVGNFSGDIAAAGLREALQACSFKNEIILLTSTLDVLDNALQLHSSIIKLGLAHQILLTPDHETCAKATAIFPRLCCVWSSLALPPRFFQHQLLLWNVRRSMAARSVRLGFHTLVLDTDVVIFDDPYKYLKSGPLQHINLMTMGETWPYADNSLLNLGWLYAQNVRVDGPVAAMLAEVPDRQLRYADDGGARLAELWGVEPNCGTDEQLLFDDVLYGAVLGRPVSVVSMNMCGGATRQQHEANYTLLARMYGQLATGPKQVFQKETLAVPEEWRALVGAPTMMLKTARLRWWRSGGEWPVEYGGELLPAARGPLSSAFQQLLRSECAQSAPNATPGDCPMWPDPSAPATGADAAQDEQRVETFALSPPWLVASFSARGVHGYWGQHPAVPVQQVLGHIHQTPCDGYVGKRGIMQYLGQYNWTLAQQVKGPGALFFASLPERPLPQLVALAPCTRLGRLVNSLEDFKAVLRGMAAVAALMGDRAILLPDLPCSLPWVREEPGAAGTAAGGRAGGKLEWELPLRLRNDYMARGALVGQGPMCTWQRFMISGCVSRPLLGLLSWEYEQYQVLVRAQGLSTAPSADNTLALLAEAKGTTCGSGARRKAKGGTGERHLMEEGDEEEGYGEEGYGEEGVERRGGGGRRRGGVGGGDGQGRKRMRRRRRREGEGGGGGGGGGEGGHRRGARRRRRRRAPGGERLEGRGSGVEGRVQWPEQQQEEYGDGGESAGYDARRLLGGPADGGGGGGGRPAAGVWEIEAHELLSVLRQYGGQQVLYLRRPLLVTWGAHAQDGSALAQAKLRYEAMLEGCFTLKPDPKERPETLPRRKWSPQLLQD